VAIDWDQTALHLRYLSVQEKAFTEDSSVEASIKAATEPITLNKCLEAFTRQEELGEEEKYYCSSCKSHQLASKKLQIWRLPPILIVHLKRFHFLNGRWIKSHKIVDFPFHVLDPTDYLGAIPQQTLRRHKELLSLGSRMRSTLVKSSYSQCNGTIKEASEGESSLTDNGSSVGDDDYDEDDGEAEAPKVNGHETSNDSAFGKSDSSGLVASIDDDDDDDSEDVFEKTASDNNGASSKSAIFSPSSGRRRSRQQSTSLLTDPIKDDDLQDFHEHHLQNGKDPLDISYEMYAMVVSSPFKKNCVIIFYKYFFSSSMQCHSGVLGGGHYISYSKSTAGKWYCQNDSACKVSAYVTGYSAISAIVQLPAFCKFPRELCNWLGNLILLFANIIPYVIGQLPR
jgi:ubiquitin carboxyl-terminal hydrolase 6/32